MESAGLCAHGEKLYYVQWLIIKCRLILLRHTARWCPASHGENGKHHLRQRGAYLIFHTLWFTLTLYRNMLLCIISRISTSPLHSGSTEELISAGRLVLMPLCFDLSLLRTIKGLFPFWSNPFKLLLYPIYVLHRELCYSGRWASSDSDL